MIAEHLYAAAEGGPVMIENVIARDKNDGFEASGLGVVEKFLGGGVELIRGTAFDDIAGVVGVGDGEARVAHFV